MAGTDVFYLAWPPHGIELVERFARSYRACPSGSEHRLTILVKGAVPSAYGDRCSALAAELGSEVIGMPATGLDLETYRTAAAASQADSVCFLNSSSEILAAGWLAALRAALDGAGVGLAGATGSLESARSAAPRPLRPLRLRGYPPFPNPHIRTNAFALERELMLALDWRPAHRKRAALELESGRQGITRQVQSRNLTAVVVGRDGVYEQAHWRESRTFRDGEQENLLVADNRTRQYAHAPAARRTALAAMAWGTGPSRG